MNSKAIPLPVTRNFNVENAGTQLEVESKLNSGHEKLLINGKHLVMKNCYSKSLY